DPTDMVRLKPNVGVVADAKAGTQALLDSLAGSGRTDRTREFAERNEDARSRFSAVQPQLAYLDAIREALTRGIDRECKSGGKA
ncbi:hypothetical protein ACCS53_38455, partial [Rhizobium ruizarguesonis]